MSNKALDQALNTRVGRSSAKFILVAMANLAGDDMLCWPSIPYLCDATDQDRKTVIENLKLLRDAGRISDTGERKGATGQIIVYRINDPENGTVISKKHVAPPLKKVATESKNEPEIGMVNSSENGTVSEPQTVPKADANKPEFGTVTPDSNSPNFPGKESQFSLLTVPNFPTNSPKNGTRTPQYTSGHQKDTLNKNKGVNVAFPEWIPVDAWNGFVAMRKAIKKPVTPDAIPLALKKLESLRAAGFEPRAVLEQSTLNCWQGLFEVKGQNPARASPAPRPPSRHNGFESVDYNEGIDEHGRIT